jgi:hypothetical protein
VFGEIIVKTNGLLPILASVAALSAWGLSASGALATTYTEGTFGEDLGPGLGSAGSDVPTWGVSFTAPGDNLTSWSFITDGVGTGKVGNVVFTVAAWDGDHVSSAPLYTSAPTTVSSVLDTTLTFTGFSLNLTAGQTYIAFLDTLDSDTSPPRNLNLLGNFQPGVKPSTVLDSQGQDDRFNFHPLSATDTWISQGVIGPAFSATFSPAGVPEPLDWILMVAGFGGVGSALRRAKRDSSVMAVGA